MRTFWGGNESDDERERDWSESVKAWRGTILAGGNGSLNVFPQYGAGKSFRIRILDASTLMSAITSRIRLTLQFQKKNDYRPEWQVHCVAWALSIHDPTEPLAIVAANNLIFVFHLKSRRRIGLLRGHGGVSLNPFFIVASELISFPQ